LHTLTVMYINLIFNHALDSINIMESIKIPSTVTSSICPFLSRPLAIGQSNRPLLFCFVLLFSCSSTFISVNVRFPFIIALSSFSLLLHLVWLMTHAMMPVNWGSEHASWPSYSFFYSVQSEKPSSPAPCVVSRASLSIYIYIIIFSIIFRQNYFILLTS
jgi:hypothetical protein